MALRKDGSLVDNFPGQKPTRFIRNSITNKMYFLVWFGSFDMFGHLLFSREAWYAAIKDFIWARSSELSLSQQNVKGDLKFSNHVLLDLIKFKIMFCQILFCIRSIVAKFKDKHKFYLSKYAFFRP